ncbi:hypothetical protein CLOM_g18131 [Closterium sp. NIES-68]|nr:hypothetical protein CLOM_g18131 [Closterium sp. NIES-68]
MPADWLPPWTEILQAPSVTEGLEGLLGDEVEVEVFRLDFRNDSRNADRVVSSTIKRALGDLEMEEAEDTAAGDAKKRRCVEDSINNKSSLPSILTACPEKHPLFFSHATCHRVQLMQGEAIFIPAGWWH